MIDSKQGSEPWFRPPSHSDKHSASEPSGNQQQAIVIGAGLAGCCSAWSLANRGWKVTLLDASKELASGASSNPLALFRPHITREPTKASDFSLASFNIMRALLSESRTQQGNSIDFTCDGVLQLLHKAQQFPASPIYTRLSKQQAQALTGLAVASGGLFFDTAGQVNVPSLCRWLIQSNDIRFHPQCQVLSLSHHQNLWRIQSKTSTFEAPYVVLANGVGLANFTETRGLTLTSVRGQTSTVNAPLMRLPSPVEAANRTPTTLKAAICGKHSIIPLTAKENIDTTKSAQYPTQQWQLGATYLRDSTDDATKDQDDRANLLAANSLFENSEDSCFDTSDDSITKTQTTATSRETTLNSYSSVTYPNPVFTGDEPILQSWAGIRATTPDRLPLCGPVPDFAFYQKAYADLRHGKPAANYPDARYQPGLYVIGGFGSRGVSVAAHCALVLADCMTGATKHSTNQSSDPQVLNTLQLLHPARFLIRRLRKQPA